MYMAIDYITQILIDWYDLLAVSVRTRLVECMFGTVCWQSRRWRPLMAVCIPAWLSAHQAMHQEMLQCSVSVYIIYVCMCVCTCACACACVCVPVLDICLDDRKIGVLYNIWWLISIKSHKLPSFRFCKQFIRYQLKIPCINFIVL